MLLNESLDILDLIFEYSSLTPVKEIPSTSAEFYYKKANAIKKYCISEFLNNPEAAHYPLFGDWCRYISRFSTCTIAPHPSEFLSERLPITTTPLPALNTTTQIANISPSSVVTSFSNTTGCYDDYFCENDAHGSLCFIVYGVIFTLLCSAGLLLNVACVVGFNKSTNRCGATLYFSIIAILDCIYLSIKLALKVSVHLSDVNYSGQVKTYAERVAYFIPGVVPLLTFCELTAVWLLVCLLVERYLYLRRGYFYKSVTSLQLHVRIVLLVSLLASCYVVPRFFEFKSEKNSHIPGGYRVIYTQVGSSQIYRSLVDYLLNIPLEMFLPYLAVGLMTSLAVSKMADLGSSKWKTVASLCSRSAYCCCGDDFANCYPTPRSGDEDIANRTVSPPLDSVDAISNLPRLSAFEDPCPKVDEGTQVYYCGIPFEKRSNPMPFYFLVPPPRQTLKETANVMITVCLGFLLLITKIPRLVIVALELEHYIETNPMFTRMVSECLTVAFIVLKPPIYLILGVHFRHALTGLCCCACLYAPVIGGGYLGNHAEQGGNGGGGGDDSGGDGVDDSSKESPDAYGEDAGNGVVTDP